MPEQTRLLVIGNKAIDVGDVEIVFDEEALEDFRTTINGEKAVRQNLNHDPRFFPIGKIREARKEHGNGSTLLYATLDDTHVTKRTKYAGPKQNLLTVSFPNDQRPFALDTSTDVFGVDVRTDPRNFPNFEGHQQFQRWVSAQSPVITAGEALRLAEIPEPLIHFIVSHKEAATLIALWLGSKAMQFVENTANSTVKNLADRAGISLSEKIVEIAKRFCGQQVEKDSAATAVVTIKTQPEINLVTRNRDVSEHLDFDADQLARILKKYDSVIRDSDSITFYRETKEQDWKFRYSTTPDGKVITTKATYGETIHELERLRRTWPVCICLKNTETGEDHHYETSAEMQPIDSDGETSRYQIYFDKPPFIGQDGWEITTITLDPQGEHRNEVKKETKEIRN